MKISISKSLRISFFALILVFSVAFQSEDKPVIYLAGDSTMAEKSTRDFPETGWGMPLHTFFDDKIKIDNRARNGRSTLSFIREGRWQSIMDDLKKGDFVFIQFGHNDEVPSKVGRYTTPDQFKANLTKFIKETREKDATPILFTPITRRRFDDQGNVVRTHPEYSPLVREVANETNTPLIDMDKMSMDLLQDFGPGKSKLLYLQLEPGEHPNYPEGVEDNTHFSQLGARKMAQLAVNEIKAQNLSLAEFIYKPTREE